MSVVKKGRLNKSAQGFVAPAQYIILTEDDKRYLLLRFENGRGETPESIEIELTERDDEGEIIAKSRRTLGVESTTTQFFSINQKIELHPKCEDFTATVVRAQFGGYSYDAKNQMDYQKLHPNFNYQKLPKNPQVTPIKQRFSPLLLGLVAALMVILSVFSYAQLLNYKKNTASFYYDNIRYEFVDQNDHSETAAVVVAGGNSSLKHLVIKDSVLNHKIVGIKPSAFKDNRSITYLEIQTDIAIPNAAFRGATNLAQVELPHTTQVGEGAFYGCSSLKNLSSTSIKTIGKDAFARSGLKIISLSSQQLVTISLNAFSYLALETVDLNCYIDYDYNHSFFFNSPINSLRLLSLNHSFSLNDTTYSFADITVANLFGASTGFTLNPLSHLSIDYVDNINANFCKNIMVQTVTISNLLNPSVGVSAFEGCTKLTELNLPQPLQTIGDFAFSNSAIPTLDGSALKSLGRYAFSSAKLTKFYDLNTENLTAIGEYCFLNSAIAEFTVGSSVNTISTGAFQNCSLLEQLTIEHGVQQIAALAFNGCVILPQIIVPDSVTSMANGIFEQCLSLANLSLPFLGSTAQSSEGRLLDSFANGSYSIFDHHLVPSSLKSVSLTAAKIIAPFAFYGLSNIETVQISGTVSEIGNDAFNSCTSLNAVIVGGSPKKIGSYAFANCYQLTTFEISPTVEVIGNYSFSSCSSLTEFTVPSTTHTIEEFAFEGCYKLFEVYNLSALKIERSSLDLGRIGYFALKIYSAKTQPKMVKFSYNGGQFAIDSLGKYKLIGYDLPQTATLPQNIMHNGNPVSYSIVKYLFHDSSVRSLTIPNGVEGIDEFAFFNCQNLKTVYIANSVKEIGVGAFTYCYKITDLTLPFVGKHRTGDFSLSYIFNYSSFTALTNLTVTDQEVLPNFAFSYFNGLMNITLPQNLQEIGENAFNQCPLTEITLPQGLKRIGNYAFMGNTLTTIDLPASLEWAGYQAFSYTQLETVRLNGNPQLAQNAFYGCYKLLDVYNLGGATIALGSDDMGGIAKNAKFIHTSPSATPMRDRTVGNLRFKNSGNLWVLMGLINPVDTLNLGVLSYQGTMIASYSIVGEAFAGSNLKSVTISSAVASIGEYAFSSNSQLKRLDMSNSTLTSIPIGLAVYCHSLSEVSLPSTLTSIGAFAFMECYQLNRIEIPALVSFIDGQAFHNCLTLFDVNNLSALNLVKGDSSHGYVAYHAFDLSEQALDYVETAEGFSFMKYLGEWYLTKIPKDNDTAALPKSFVFNQTTIDSYILHEGALHNYSASIFVPKSVKGIKSALSSSLWIHAIHYEGTEGEWNTLMLTDVNNKLTSIAVSFNRTN